MKNEKWNRLLEMLPDDALKELSNLDEEHVDEKAILKILAKYDIDIDNLFAEERNER